MQSNAFLQVLVNHQNELNAWTTTKSYKSTPSALTRFTFKTRIFTITFHHHNSPGNLSRELFMPSKDVVGFLVRIYHGTDLFW